MPIQEIPVKEKSEEYDIPDDDDGSDDFGFEGLSFDDVLSPDDVKSTTTDSELAAKAASKKERLAAMQEGLDKLFVEEMKIFATRRNILRHNLTKLYGSSSVSALSLYKQK